MLERRWSRNGVFEDIRDKNGQEDGSDFHGESIPMIYHWFVMWFVYNLHVFWAPPWG